MSTVIKKAAPVKKAAPANKPIYVPVPTGAKSGRSLEDYVIATLPAVVRRANIEDVDSIADVAIAIGTAVYTRINKK